MFFSYLQGNKRICLHYDMIRSILKECVQHFQFPPANFSTHSLRLGGACALRAAGASDSTILFMGRWKSLPACLSYQEMGTAEFDHALELLNGPELLTNNDINLIQIRASELNKYIHSIHTSSSQPSSGHHDAEDMDL